MVSTHARPPRPSQTRAAGTATFRSRPGGPVHTSYDPFIPATRLAHGRQLITRLGAPKLGLVSGERWIRLAWLLGLGACATPASAPDARSTPAPDAFRARVPDAFVPFDGGPPVYGSCEHACRDVNDCASTGIGIYQPTNYSCTDGYCAWLGCLADGQCAQEYRSDQWVCRELFEIPGCVLRCRTSTDCGPGNNACTDGVCRPLGCRDDVDCETWHGSDFVCRVDESTPLGRAGIATCIRECTQPTDCGPTGGVHYACESGICSMLGCVADAECEATAPGRELECRAL